MNAFDREKNVKTRNIIVTLIALVALVLLVRMLASGPSYEYDTDYGFEYTVKNTVTANDGRIVEARLFIFSDSQSYSAPTESAGRAILVLDRSLPMNTFRLVRKDVPALGVGGQTFDPGGKHTEVHYNFNGEVQTVVPRVTPKNTPR